MLGVMSGLPSTPLPRTPLASASSSGEEWLSQIASCIDELLWVLDPISKQLSYGNPAFRSFWYLPTNDLLEQILTRPWDQGLHPSDRENVVQFREHANPQETLEYRVTRPDGQSAWLRERIVILRSPSGDALQHIHIAKDISWYMNGSTQLHTEISRRTNAERHASDLSRRLQTLIDTANDAVVSIDSNSIVIDWNSTAEKMFGWTRREALGQTLTDLIVPIAHRNAHHMGLRRYLNNGQGPLFNSRVETTAIHKNGNEFDVELSVWPVCSGNSCTFSSFVRDISQRKAAERALVNSEAKYRAVVENVSEGILITAQGRILYANRRALELTGLDEAVALSRPFIEFIHPEDRQRVLSNHMARLRGETVENHYNFRVLHTCGDVRWLEISAVVFEWQGQTATLNFLTDVTRKRQVEQEMQVALDRERELSEMKTRFVAVTSHEFRTPLAAILSSVELLDDFGNRLGDAEHHEISQFIRSAVLRMNSMIDQVLLMSKLEGSHMGFMPTPTPLQQLLEQMVTEVALSHPGGNRMTLECNGLDTPRLVDAKLLRHIVINLLSNALKYSDNQRPVLLRANAEGDRVYLQFTDQGIGIPEADIPHLFETFHRGTNVGNIQGTGLGLNVVRECVKLHCGHIEVHSQTDKGTCFDVQLHAPTI